MEKKAVSVTMTTLLLASLLLVASLASFQIGFVSSSLTPHAPILIDGDANFTPANGVTGGSGTAVDPYTIEGWDINAVTAHGIEIKNTRAFFIIRNVTIHDGAGNYDGIRFLNISDGQVENVTSTNNAFGILVWSSTQVSIYSNTVSSNMHSGIHVSRSNYTIVSNNIALYNTWGPVTAGGIEVNTYSNNIIVSYNNASYGGSTAGPDGGIWISGQSTNVTALGNYASHNRRGIYFGYAATNVNITGNTIVDNSYIGIDADSRGVNLIVYNNYLRNTANAHNRGAENWNISKTLDVNIVGGPYLGGNYYHNYGGTDADGDGIGDTPYSIAGGSSVDYLPLVRIPDIVKTFIASWKSVDYPVQVYAPNTTLSGFNFNRTQKQINLTVAAGATRFVNVTMPIELMEGALTALVDGKPTAAITTWNLTLMPVGPPTGTTSVYITVEKGIRNIQIIAQFAARLQGDINGDGKVDIKDIAFVAKNFGKVDP